MREVHTALIKTRLTRKDDGWITTNELVWLIYPEPNTWQYRERQRFAVRKAIAALRRDRIEGIWVLKEGEGSDERVRADLTNWSGRYLKTPQHRKRRPAPPPPEKRSNRRVSNQDRDWQGLPLIDDTPAHRPAGLRGRVAPCGKCKREGEDECSDFLSGGWPEECRRCGHLDSDHGTKDSAA